MYPLQWTYNVLLGLDQFLNTIIGGKADETISARAGRSNSLLGRGINKILNIFQRKHGLKALEYTPWGTADPHSLEAVQEDIAADWNALIAVMESVRDLDAWPQATLDAAQRALERLNAWDGKERWQRRIDRDLQVGNRFQR